MQLAWTIPFLRLQFAPARAVARLLIMALWGGFVLIEALFTVTLLKSLGAGVLWMALGHPLGVQQALDTLHSADIMAAHLIGLTLAAAAGLVRLSVRPLGTRR